MEIRIRTDTSNIASEVFSHAPKGNERSFNLALVNWTYFRSRFVFGRLPATLLTFLLFSHNNNNEMTDGTGSRTYHCVSESKIPSDSFRRVYNFVFLPFLTFSVPRRLRCRFENCVCMYFLKAFMGFERSRYASSCFAFIVLMLSTLIY